MSKLQLELLKCELGVLKLPTNTAVPSEIYSSSFYSLTRSDEELSIVADHHLLRAIKSDLPVWKAIRFTEILDFSLVGILSKISQILAAAEVSIFAISTYNTDYILIKKEDLNKALEVLKDEYSLIKQA